MAKLRIQDLDLAGKRVLMRCDFNVPLDGKAGITDDSRIRAALPSIKYVIEKGGKLILMSHLDRPKGKPDPKLTLSPVAQRLSQLLNHKITKMPDCIGPAVEQTVQRLRNGDVLVLEVHKCPAIQHLKQSGFPVMEKFCESTRITNEEICAGAGLKCSVEYDRENGCCVQKFWEDRS